MFDIFSFPNKSIAGIFYAALSPFIIPFIIKQKRRGIFIVLLFLITMLVGLLVISNSRAGWLGFAAGLIYIICFHIPLNKKKLFLLIASFVFLLSFFILLFYKPGSSSGRLHIYSISIDMLRDNWANGIGLGKFKALFNEYQANYFSAHSIDSKRALLADNTFYAFNDYLQWIIETGIVGFLSLAFFLYLISRRVLSINVTGNGNKPILISITASLISVAVAALFSYPLQIITLQAVVLICFAILAFYPSAKSSISLVQKIMTITYKYLIVILIIAFAYNTWKVADRKAIGKNAFELAKSGYKIKAISKYKELTAKYPDAGYNWFSYAEQLYYSNRLTEAIECLNKCRFHYVDNKVYKLQADIEQELKRCTEAENSYLRTIYMVPNRMGSRFDLLNFYLLRKDTLNSLYWANSILSMPVKVPSAKVDNMLRQTKLIIESLKK